MLHAKCRARVGATRREGSHSLSNNRLHDQVRLDPSSSNNNTQQQQQEEEEEDDKPPRPGEISARSKLTLAPARTSEAPF